VPEGRHMRDAPILDNKGYKGRRVKRRYRRLPISPLIVLFVLFVLLLLAGPYVTSKSDSNSSRNMVALTVTTIDPAPANPLVGRAAAWAQSHCDSLRRQYDEYLNKIHETFVYHVEAHKLWMRGRLGYGVPNDFLRGMTEGPRWRQFSHTVRGRWGYTVWVLQEQEGAMRAVEKEARADNCKL
jgi:hypothetical protein